MQSSERSEEIFEKMVERLYKANILITKLVQKNLHFCMSKLNIKLFIDPPKTDHGAFVAIGR